MKVIDRIIEQNKALWSLLTNNSATREQKLDYIARAFPESDISRALRMRDESSPGTTSFALWNEEVKRLSR